MLASTSYHPPSAPSRVGQAGRLGGAARRCRAPCGARTRAQRPDSGSEGEGTTGGDPQVQDALVSELRTQIEIEKSFEAGKQQVRRRAATRPAAEGSGGRGRPAEQGERSPPVPPFLV